MERMGNAPVLSSVCEIYAEASTISKGRALIRTQIQQYLRNKMI